MGNTYAEHVLPSILPAGNYSSMVISALKLQKRYRRHKLLKKNWYNGKFMDLSLSIGKVPSGQKPDAIIMDIDLPSLSGKQGVWQLKQKWPDMKILKLTVFKEENKIFDAIKAGAKAICSKTFLENCFL